MLCGKNCCPIGNIWDDRAVIPLVSITGEQSFKPDSAGAPDGYGDGGEGGRPGKLKGQATLREHRYALSKLQRQFYITVG